MAPPVEDRLDQDDLKFLEGMGLDMNSLLGPEDEEDTAPKVWLPGKKGSRKYRDYSERPGRGGEFAEHGRLQPESTKTWVVEPEKEENAATVSTWVYDPEKRKQIEAYLAKKGIQFDSFDELEKIWQQAVGRASDAYTASGGALKKSPWDMLDLVTPPEDTGPRPVKGLSWSSSQTDVDMAEMPPEMVRQGITTMLQDLLGRGPTEAEVNDFAARAAAIAAEDPYTRTTTSQMEWDEELEQYVNKGSVTEESGISQAELNAQTQEMAREDIANSTEAKEFGRVRGINIVMGMLGLGE